MVTWPAVKDVSVSFAYSMAFGNFGPHGHLPFHWCGVHGHMAQVEFGRVIDNRVKVLNRPVFGDRRLRQSGDVFEVGEESGSPFTLSQSMPTNLGMKSG